MAASTREVFLLLRARDEASRVLRGFSSELIRSSAVIQAAAMRSRSVELQREVTARRQEVAVLAAAVADKIAEAAATAKRLADVKAAGASVALMDTLRKKELALKKEAAEINNRIRVMDKEVSAMVAEIRMLDRQSSELERSHRLQRQLAQAINSTSASVTTLGVGLAGVGVAASYFFVQAFKAFQEYERQVALTRTQIDGFTASLEQVSAIGLKIANEVPVAFEQIQPALFDIFSSTSANLRQSEILLEGFARAAVAGQTDIQTAARGTIAIMNGLHVPFEDVNKVLDVQFELVRKGVGTYAEFAAVFGRVIPAANRSQQTFETVAAMLAFMTRNGQSAAQAATSAARALELFTHPGAVKNLEKMGIKVRDLQGNYLPLVDILKQLRAEMNKLPQADRVGAMVEAFKGSGFNIQARRFLEQVVLGKGELENFEDLLKSMGNAAGVMGDKYGEMADTAAAKTQLLANRWEILKIAMGEAVAPVLLKIIELLSGVLNWFNNLDPATKRMITNIALFATGLALVSGALLIFVGTLAGVVAAVVAAGTTLLIIAGTVAALGIAFAGLTTAIALAWKKSEGFRGLVRDTVQDVKDLYGEIKTLGDRLKRAFDAETWPALQRLNDLLREEVMPAVQQFRQEVVDAVLPKVTEALRIIGDIGERTLKVIGETIDTYLVPILQQLSDWWGKNKDELMPFIVVLGQMLKWLLIIAAVLGGSGIVGALSVAVAGFLGLANMIMFLVEVFKTSKVIVMGLVALLIGAGMAIAKSVSSTWGKYTQMVRESFNALGEWFKGALGAVVGFLSVVWEGFWAAFGEPIKAAWELVKAVLDAAVTVVQIPIKLLLGVIGFLWDTFWILFVAPVIRAWDYVTNTVGAGTGKAKQLIDQLVEAAKAVWNVFWALLIGPVKSAWDMITAAVARGANAVWSTLKSWRDNILSVITSIKDFFVNLGVDMVRLGANIIQGLIDGITSKIKALTDKVKEITQKIKDFLPSSPAKVGPLSGAGSPFKSGQAISDMLAAGMLYQTDAIRNASLRVAAATIPSPDFLAGQSVLTPVELGNRTQGPLTPMRSNYVTVNVYTNEIDPRSTAAELGYELEGQL